MTIILNMKKKSRRFILAAVIFTVAFSCVFTGCSGRTPDFTGTPAPESAFPTPTYEETRASVKPDISIYDNRYIIFWQEDFAPVQRQAVLETLEDFTVVSEFDKNYTVVRNETLKPESVISLLRSLPGVVAVDPDYIISTETFSNDTFSDSQWPLHNPGTYRYYFTNEPANPILLPTREDIDLNFPEARDLYSELVQNPREVVIAVIDTGIDISHPDLRDCIWTNPLEIPGDGIDNDGNGYIDDVYGWDFYNDDNTLIHLDKDENGSYIDNDTHGTQVAGVIAATSGNGLGISGAASFVPVKLMSLKINGGPNGLGSVSSAIRAINYATEMGADICNMSWGSASISATLETLEAAMKTSDMLFVCAAGNSGTDNDVYPIYPASLRLPNNISVTFVNELGKLVEQTVSADGTPYGSNFGKNTVDIAAPGSYILTTSPSGAYSAPSGSSMAAPYVSAIAAMLMSTQEGLYPADVKNLILATAKRIPGDMVTPTPTATPTPDGFVPTPTPDGIPTVTPGTNPTGTPGEVPTVTPGVNPTGTPGGSPTGTPGGSPTGTPGENPTETPGEPPTETPGSNPTVTPGEALTGTPSVTSVPETTGAPSETPGAGTATPGITPGPQTPAPEPPTATPVPTPVPEISPEPSVTGTPGPSDTDPSGTPEPDPTTTPGSNPTVTPGGPQNPFLSLEGKLQVPGIPNMYDALLLASTLTPDTEAPEIIVTRTFEKSIIVLNVQGSDALSGPRVVRYIKETSESIHTLDFFRRGIGGTAFSEPLKIARPGIYTFYVSDYAGNETLIRYEVQDDKTSPEIRLFTTLKSPSGVTMAVLDVNDFESGVNTFMMLPGQHVASDFTAAGVKPTKLEPVDGRLLIRFSGSDVYTLYATDFRGNSMTYEIELVP